MLEVPRPPSILAVMITEAKDFPLLYTSSIAKHISVGLLEMGVTPKEIHLFTIALHPSRKDDSKESKSLFHNITFKPIYL